MYIHEAIKARTEEKPYITRESWNYSTSVWYNAAIKIMPTNTPDCCVIDSFATKNPGCRWNPTADDLTADDWVTTEY